MELEFSNSFLERKPERQWIIGDVRSFPIGTDRFDVMVHAATDVVAHASPEDVFSTCLDGTRRVV